MGLKLFESWINEQENKVSTLIIGGQTSTTPISLKWPSQIPIGNRKVDSKIEGSIKKDTFEMDFKSSEDLLLIMKDLFEGKGIGEIIRRSDKQFKNEDVFSVEGVGQVVYSKGQPGKGYSFKIEDLKNKKIYLKGNGILALLRAANAYRKFIEVNQERVSISKLIIKLGGNPSDPNSRLLAYFYLPDMIRRVKSSATSIGISINEYSSKSKNTGPALLVEEEEISELKKYIKFLLTNRNNWYLNSSIFDESKVPDYFKGSNSLRETYIKEVYDHLLKPAITWNFENSKLEFHFEDYYGKGFQWEEEWTNVIKDAFFNKLEGILKEKIRPLSGGQTVASQLSTRKEETKEEGFIG